MQPRVSVVIPTYNRKAVLCDAIASVQRQTLPVEEILVCDDGSTDGSREAVEAIAAADARVRWIAGEHTGFPGAVKNRGLRLARGDWIAFQDSDDLWLAHKNEVQFRVLQRAPGAQFIYCHAAELFPGGRTSRMTPFNIRREGRVFDTFLMWSVVQTPTVLVRRDLIQRCGGFDEAMRLRIAQDYECWMRIAAEVPFYFVDEELVHCRLQADSTSADLFGGIDEFERALQSLIARFHVSDALAREALCRIELRRYKHHLLRNYPRDARLRDLRGALAKRPAHPLGLALLASERLGLSALLRRLLSALEWRRI
jgi:glycosyltransferase involved in cell wall biosynthesis